MAEAAKADTTLRADSETVATHDLHLKHKTQLLKAEMPVLVIEQIASTLMLIACSDSVQEDEPLAASLLFLSNTLTEECNALRGRLYG